MASLLKLDTPCIGICSTVYGDNICRGCKRTSQEVIDWNNYGNADKEKIFERLENLQIEVMKNKINILDAKKLRNQLEIEHIRYREESNPLCWAYHLIRVKMDKINDLAAYGAEIQTPYQSYSLRKLFTLIDEELLKLSKQCSDAISK